MSALDRLGSALVMLLCLLYIIMLGGGTYEQMNVTKLIVTAPPASFDMLMGEFPFSPVVFWTTFRPLTILLFIVTLVLCWKKRPTRNVLLAAFGIDSLVTISTFLYFAPEVGSMISAAAANRVEGLEERAVRWYSLNYVRLAVFYVVGLLLLFAHRNFTLESKTGYEALTAPHQRMSN
ncbi:MAG TPA: hypothetical protein VGD40_07090 [Chryseosolibacter sp.]